MNEAIYQSICQDDHFVIVPVTEGLQFQVGSYSDLDHYEIGYVTLNPWAVDRMLAALWEWKLAALRREAVSPQSERSS